MKPKLKHYEGSYAVVSLETGKAVAELDKNSELLDKINTRKYKLVPIGAYLAGLNRKENPTMKRKPTPAQIAARERFAAMARSGAFKKKAAKAKKATDDTRTVSQKLKEYAINNAILERVESGQSVKSAYDAVLGKGAYERLAGELYDEIRKTKSNPAKKTVSQKISQLTREGYPQKQAVAIALNEERAGKVKRNPITETLIYGLAPGETRDYMEDLLYDGGLKLTQAQIDQVLKAASAAGYHSFRIAGFDPTVKPDFTKALKTGRKRNPRASNPIILVSDKAIATKRKRNPQSPTVTHKGARNIAYAVQAKRMLAGGGAQFETVAGFPTKAQAQDYIDALLKTYPKGLTLRISAA